MINFQEISRGRNMCRCVHKYFLHRLSEHKQHASFQKVYCLSYTIIHFSKYTVTNISFVATNLYNYDISKFILAVDHSQCLHYLLSNYYENFLERNEML